ncbi:TerC family protein [Spirosoma endbachense]|uniref:TerC family protein n=1 Tax=Spirosoma endbachense TaxID=2666025 RepID=A0A6P1W3T7_9BACT|nr:TerC family protein [Spirosoma endbachense]QHW00084.1 TerC family protein [Spirosoma endbachense]
MQLADNIVPLLTLIVLETILGIDNIIFISILADKLPDEQRDKLRYWGIGLSMVMRLGLLALIAWIMQLDQTLFVISGIAITGKGLILLAGGLFLIYKSTKEIYHKAELGDDANAPDTAKATFRDLLIQVLILDMVFSIDSIITAVGMVEQLWVMYTAVIVTVGIMMVASKPIASFISRHPSFKVLALCFLLIIGMSLVAEGLHVEIPKGYIYFSMAFAFLVDVIQMKTVRPSKPGN